MDIGKRGVSPLIASVLSILFGVMMLAIVLTVIRPTLKHASDSSTVTDIFQNLQLINSVIKEVSSEAEGSKRTVPVTISEGEYRINAMHDWLYAIYEPKSTLKLVGTKGDIKIEYGLEFFDSFDWYVEGTNGTPVWTNTSGQWAISSLKYLGTNGSTYMNINPRPIENFEFGGKITNISGPAGGQIFVLPTASENLLGYWTFDTGGGDKTYDYAGNQNTGTLTNMDTGGSPTSGWQNTTNCKFGSCLMFDGSNDYVNVPDDTNLEPSGDFTISLWLKTTQTGSRVILEKDDTNGYSIQRESNNALKINVGGSGEIETSGSYNDGNWHHVIFVYRSENDGSVYVDGRDNTGVSTPGTPLYGPDALTIGSRDGGSGFNGAIDEVMIFDRALTVAEVATLYETSVKKLRASGSQSISARTYGTIVLSNPGGQTQFDDVKVVRQKNELSFVIPYSNVDITGSLRLRKGEHLISITHMGINATSSKAIIEVKAS